MPKDSRPSWMKASDVVDEGPASHRLRLPNVVPEVREGILCQRS